MFTLFSVQSRNNNKNRHPVVQQLVLPCAHQILNPSVNIKQEANKSVLILMHTPLHASPPPPQAPQG